MGMVVPEVRLQGGHGGAWATCPVWDARRNLIRFPG